MRVDWCVSSWFRIKNTHSLTPRAWLLFIFLHTYTVVVRALPDDVTKYLEAREEQR